jgi:hypothetical protein
LNPSKTVWTAYVDDGMTEQPRKGPASYFPSIERKYGLPIAEWKPLVRARYPAKHIELGAFLKAEHGLGRGHANAIVADNLAEDQRLTNIRQKAAFKLGWFA